MHQLLTHPFSFSSVLFVVQLGSHILKAILDIFSRSSQLVFFFISQIKLQLTNQSLTTNDCKVADIDAVFLTEVGNWQLSVRVIQNGRNQTQSRCRNPKVGVLLAMEDDIAACPHVFSQLIQINIVTILSQFGYGMTHDPYL